MFDIDFKKLPKIEEKLEGGEIVSLNWLFQDPTIQSQLEAIEENRKIRSKWKIGIYLFTAGVTGGLSFFLGQWDLVAGFLYTIGSWDDSFSPTIWAMILSYSIPKWILYTKFASKIEIPLKKEVLTKLCPILYSKLEYSYDGKYSFNELDKLQEKEFLQSYDSIDLVEDSTTFTMEKDRKWFSMNGFELKTSEVRGSGKNRRRVTTNHCYLMKIAFPYARIPLQDDLRILTDQADTNSIEKWFLPFFLGFIWTIFLPIMLSTIHESLFWIGIIGWIGFGVWLHFYVKRKHNTHRVQLENIEFEKVFDVKCEDQITSRMILTPAFMDRIVQFVQKTNHQYEFLFESNILYVKRHILSSYLEAGTEKNILTNLSGFVQFYIDMKEIIQFSHDMNLMYLSKTTATPLPWNDVPIIQNTPIILDGWMTQKNRWLLSYFTARVS